jgi:hypothetical protein
MLDKLPADMDGEAASPAANHLFKVNKNEPSHARRADIRPIPSQRGQASLALQES